MAEVKMVPSKIMNHSARIRVDPQVELSVQIKSIMQNWGIALSSYDEVLPPSLRASGLPVTYTPTLVAALYELSCITVGQKHRAHSLLTTYFQMRIRIGNTNDARFATLEEVDVLSAMKSVRRISEGRRVQEDGMKPLNRIVQVEEKGKEDDVGKVDEADSEDVLGEKRKRSYSIRQETTPDADEDDVKPSPADIGLEKKRKLSDDDTNPDTQDRESTSAPHSPPFSPLSLPLPLLLAPPTTLTSKSTLSPLPSPALFLSSLPSPTASFPPRLSKPIRIRRPRANKHKQLPTIPTTLPLSTQGFGTQANCPLGVTGQNSTGPSGMQQGGVEPSGMLHQYGMNPNSVLPAVQRATHELDVRRFELGEAQRRYEEAWRRWKGVEVERERWGRFCS